MTDSTPPAGGRHSLGTDSSLSPVPSPHRNGAGHHFGVNPVAYGQAHDQPQQQLRLSLEAGQNSKFPANHRDITKSDGVADRQPRLSHPTFGASNSTTSHLDFPHNTSAISTASKVPRKRKAPDTSGHSTPSSAKNNDTPKEKKPRKPREPRLGPDGLPLPRKPRASADGPKVHKIKAPDNVTMSKSVQQSLGGAISHPRVSEGSSAEKSSLPVSQPSRPATSGQRYDPIRGALFDSPAPSLATPPKKPSPIAQPANRSPTVANLINSPDSRDAQRNGTTRPKSPIQVTSAPSNRKSSLEGVTSSPQKTSTSFVPVTTVPIPGFQSVNESRPQPMNLDGVMDVDTPGDPTLKSAEKDFSAKANSSGPTPKPKKTTPPLAKIQATGSGLLSSSDLFGGPSQASQKATQGGVDIDFRIVLDPDGNNTINLAQEIIKRYGRDALNPRAVAHRERLLQVAAAANKLDQGSGDDMSLDLSDPENDSNNDVGQSSKGDKSGAENGTKPKRRARKIEDYDKDDDFIDDTEMAWEAQAAVAKDGFFVYAGLLVPEEQPKTDQSVQGAKTKGRRAARPKPDEPKAIVYNRDGSIRKKPGPRPRAETGGPPPKRPRKKKDAEGEVNEEKKQVPVEAVS